MKQSEIYRQNAENCAYLAEGAANEPTRQRYKRMEAPVLARWTICSSKGEVRNHSHASLYARRNHGWRRLTPPPRTGAPQDEN